MSRAINVISLFDGISCARVALERAGIDVKNYRASEVDKYAISVSKKNRPGNIQLGDVNGLDTRYINHPIDLIIWGSPCQDLSIAKNNRKWLDGARSGLFYKYVEAIKKYKPKYFILENVASMRPEDRDTISGILWVEPIMINAALVSAQNRKRYFWTNIPNIPQPDDLGIMLKDGLEDGVNHIYQVPRGFNAWGIKEGKAPTMWANAYQENNKPIRLGHLNKGGQGDRIYSIDAKSVCLSANGGWRGAKTGLYKVGNVNPSGRGMQGDVYDAKGKSPTLLTGKGEGRMILQEDYVIRKLTPAECERLQGLPKWYTSPVSNTQRYKCLGNAVTHILKYMPIE